MKFKVGDVVVVHKPEDITEPPVWVDKMDIFCGVEAVVQRVYDNEWGVVLVLNFPGRWAYNAKWCTLVDDFSGNI